MKRVGIYAYQSRNDYSDKVQSQIERLQEYAKSHGGTVVGIYCDTGYMGRNRRRLDLERMLKDCKEGKLDDVLILRTSRLSRKQEEFCKLYRQITENNVTLNIVENPIDEQTISLLEAIGEWQKEHKLNKQELIYEGYKAILNKQGTTARE